MGDFEVLSDTHKVHVADYDEGQKWVFNQRRNGVITSLSKIVQSTKEISITAESYENVGIQDVPEELFDFLEEEGFDTDRARDSVQF
jgi:hypothetical protein